MVLRTVNISDCPLDDSLDEAGFRHEVTAIGERLGARRMGAAVYEAYAERPIWPYHYHYSTEEWLYVIAGTPMLREPAGRRTLRAGDLLRFPTDHRGAHTLLGPGRFIIFSTNESAGPWVAVYPDSDKISVHPGRHEPTGLNDLRLPRRAAVDYWHGEGDIVAPKSPVTREPSDAPRLPVTNALAHTGAVVGDALGVTVVDLEPDAASGDYRYMHGREEWVVILSGSATLRHPGGEDVVGPGHVAAFPEGPEGAHQLRNEGSEPVRAILLCTLGLPANVCYPDSGTWVLHNAPQAADVKLRAADPADP